MGRPRPSASRAARRRRPARARAAASSALGATYLLHAAAELPSLQSASWIAVYEAWVSAPLTKTCGIVARCGKALFQSASALLSSASDFALSL